MPDVLYRIRVYNDEGSYMFSCGTFVDFNFAKCVATHIATACKDMTLSGTRVEIVKYNTPDEIIVEGA